MGLNLTGTVTGSGLIDPTSECCRPSSGISGQKFFDFDGNGVRDAGEPALAGWTIHLSTGEEVTTDVNGFYYFQNLASGVYSVSELNQPDWTQITPASGSTTVTLGAAQQVNGVDFGNWHTNDPSCIQIQCASNRVIYAFANVEVDYTVTPPTCVPPMRPFFIASRRQELLPGGHDHGELHRLRPQRNYARCSFDVTVIDGTPMFTTVRPAPIWAATRGTFRIATRTVTAISDCGTPQLSQVTCASVDTALAVSIPAPSRTPPHRVCGLTNTCVQVLTWTADTNRR